MPNHYKGLYVDAISQDSGSLDNLQDAVDNLDIQEPDRKPKDYVKMAQAAANVFQTIDQINTSNKAFDIVTKTNDDTNKEFEKIQQLDLSKRLDSIKESMANVEFESNIESQLIDAGVDQRKSKQLAKEFSNNRKESLVKLLNSTTKEINSKHKNQVKLYKNSAFAEGRNNLNKSVFNSDTYRKAQPFIEAFSTSKEQGDQTLRNVEAEYIRGQIFGLTEQKEPEQARQLLDATKEYFTHSEQTTMLNKINSISKKEVSEFKVSTLKSLIASPQIFERFISKGGDKKTVSAVYDFYNAQHTLGKSDAIDPNGQWAGQWVDKHFSDLPLEDQTKLDVAIRDRLMAIFKLKNSGDHESWRRSVGYEPKNMTFDEKDKFITLLGKAHNTWDQSRAVFGELKNSEINQIMARANDLHQYGSAELRRLKTNIAFLQHESILPENVLELAEKNPREFNKFAQVAYSKTKDTSAENLLRRAGVDLEDTELIGLNAEQAAALLLAVAGNKVQAKFGEDDPKKYDRDYLENLYDEMKDTASNMTEIFKKRLEKRYPDHPVLRATNKYKNLGEELRATRSKAAGAQEELKQYRRSKVYANQPRYQQYQETVKMVEQASMSAGYTPDNEKTTQFVDSLFKNVLLPSDQGLEAYKMTPMGLEPMVDSSGLPYLKSQQEIGEAVDKGMSAKELFDLGPTIKPTSEVPETEKANTIEMTRQELEDVGLVEKSETAVPGSSVSKKVAVTIPEHINSKLLKRDDKTTASVLLAADGSDQPTNLQNRIKRMAALLSRYGIGNTAGVGSLRSDHLDQKDKDKLEFNIFQMYGMAETGLDASYRSQIDARGYHGALAIGIFQVATQHFKGKPKSAEHGISFLRGIEARDDLIGLMANQVLIGDGRAINKVFRKKGGTGYAYRKMVTNREAMVLQAGMYNGGRALVKLDKNFLRQWFTDGAILSVGQGQSPANTKQNYGYMLKIAAIMAGPKYKEDPTFKRLYNKVVKLRDGTLVTARNVTSEEIKQGIKGKWFGSFDKWSKLGVNFNQEILDLKYVK